MLERLSNLDRRWVFLAMALAVGVPILLELKPPETPTPMTERTFEVLDRLPAGSRVLIALDYDPAGMSELHPMSSAFVRHAATKGHRIYLMTLWPTGPAFLDDMTRLLRQEFPELVYGEDYVNLGFQAGNEGVVKVIVSNLRGSFPRDAVYGRSLDTLPITADVENIRQMDLIISISGGTPGTKEWVQYAASPFGTDTIAGCTGVQTPLFIPYIPGQLDGILGGIKAAAEYESLLLEAYPEVATGQPASDDGQQEDAEQPVATAVNRNVREAQRRMGPQLVAHLLMVGLIVVGNVLYFATRRTG